MKNSLIVAQDQSQVIGVLSGWDRVVFRGCCPLFAFVDGMLKWLLHMGIWLTDYSKWALAMSDAMKKACLAEAERRGRPVRYLTSSGVRKDELARQILNENPVSEGLVCISTCLEPCETYRVRGNRQTKRLELRRERTKCLQIYKYWLDGEFGLMGARLQTWLPCGVQVWINGRVDVYWTAFQTEWATDVCFDGTASLHSLYRPMIRGAMTVLGCDNILRFMNKRRSFQGDVDSSFRRYPEGVRCARAWRT